uniref:Uncharacterized protein n=1 Tax=Desertifilum tharense IPPAS B-1220 TaxID=1781255 RepID=A0ACD5GQS8_9CYAN
MERSPRKSLCNASRLGRQPPESSKSAIDGTVMEAQQWCDQAENKEEMCQILAKREWFRVPFDDIIDRSLGKYDYGTGRVEDFSNSLVMKYWKDNASYPYKSHDLWFLTENIRWGYLKPDTDMQAIIDKVNREDLWREAAQTMGVPTAQIPSSPSRGVETFFDGVTFDPENPEAYLRRLEIKKVNI